MGNKAGKHAAMKSKEVSRLEKATGFSADEIRTLYSQFQALKGVEAKDDDLTTMSFQEFQAALGYKGKASIFIERIFITFDDNHDGYITFEEFIHGLSLLTPTVPQEKKLRFTFNIYDLSRRGKVSPNDLSTILYSVLREHGVAMTDDQVAAMVAETFRQHDLNKDGYMDYDEYQQMCVKNPDILKPLTLNVTEMIAHARSE